MLKPAGNRTRRKIEAKLDLGCIYVYNHIVYWDKQRVSNPRKLGVSKPNENYRRMIDCDHGERIEPYDQFVVLDAWRLYYGEVWLRILHKETIKFIDFNYVHQLCEKVV